MKVRRIDFSPDEWLAGAFGLKADQRGCYITVIMLIYSHGGPILDDEKELAHACNIGVDKWRSIRQILIEKEKIRIIDGGKITNNRCETELEKAKNRTEKAREIGEIGGKNSGISRRNQMVVSKENNNLPEADASSQNEPNHQPSTINHQLTLLGETPVIEDQFPKFWAAYPSRPGNPKQPARIKFNKLVSQGVDVQKIITGASNYTQFIRQSQTDPKFVAQATTWLNQERWQDYQTVPVVVPVAPRREAAI